MFSKEKITIEYTIEKCNKCHNEHKRKFTQGDFLFKEMDKCNSCDGNMTIEKIFGETIENSK